MNQLTNANSAYSNASKMVSPLRAVVLLYDRALQSALAAREAMLAGRIEDRFVHTEKVSQIIVALQGNLDFEHGGEISPMLYDFYNTIFRQLQEANLRNSVKAIEDVILGLNNVRASWHELAERTNGTPQAVSAPPAAAAGSTSGAPPAPAGKSLAISI